MVSNAKEWRKNRQEGFEVTFASGLVARIRPIAVDFFIRVGKIPDLLTPFVVKLASEGMAEFPQVSTLKDVKEFNEFLDQLTLFAFVYPEVKDTGGDPNFPLNDDQISLDDVSYQDKLAVLRALMVPAHQLEAAFSQFPKKDLGAVPAVESSDETTESDTGDRGLGD